MKIKIEIKFTNLETGKTVTSTLPSQELTQAIKSPTKIADVLNRIKGSLYLEPPIGAYKHTITRIARYVVRGTKKP